MKFPVQASNGLRRRNGHGRVAQRMRWLIAVVAQCLIRSVLALGLGWNLWATAADFNNADDAALALPGMEAEAAPKARDWKASFELAGIDLRHRFAVPESDTGQRLSFDLSLNVPMREGLRLNVANRWDGLRQSPSIEAHSVNTLKEAYFSWQLGPQQLLDFGRINVRSGVASGYNPTDVFRANAVRVATSAAPANLRENRQGSVMLRGQQLWVGGSATLLMSPKLSSAASDQRAFGLNVGATNAQNRWQLAVTQALSEGIAPQWQLTGIGGGGVEGAVGVSSLVSDQLIVFAEASYGRAASQLAQALEATGAGLSAHTRSAIGATWTNAFKMALTVEFDQNSAAPSRKTWAAMSPAERGTYGAWLQARQELAVRNMWWVYLNWQDVATRQLDLNAFVRHNPYDHSQMIWTELRYHFSRMDVTLQTQVHRGPVGSLYGSFPRSRIILAGLTAYL